MKNALNRSFVVVALASLAWAATAHAQSADLAITKTDGAASDIPGTSIAYTIVASNPVGPNDALGSTVADTFPATLTGVTWTCVGAGGGSCTAAGAGNISDSVNLPVGGTVTYTVNATIAASATGSLSNTATVTVPGGVTEVNAADNSATDTDVLTPQANLGITKTDGAATEIPGTGITYTIVASNPVGPSNVTGATVADTFPVTLTGVTWTCVGAGGGTCTAAGAGNISDSVNLPVGGTVTYTVSATIAASATGSLSNTATVTVPGGVTETSPANNSATDTDVLTPQANLGISKTDGAASEIPGTGITYTIVASNPVGPSNVTGATVADTFPVTLTGVTWTCVGAGGGTCTAAGAGNISDSVNLPVGGTATYTVNATITASATGSLSNTATVTVPGGVTEVNAADNSATDTDVLTPQADLGITKTDGAATEIPGTGITYTIVASNPVGPSNAPGSTVTDTFPGTLTGITWTCVGAGGGSCTAAGAGNISDSVNLPVGGTVTYTVSATINAAATGSLSNTATVAVSGGVTETSPANNSATDTDTLTPQANLAITKTDGAATEIPGTGITYTIVASNPVGPSNAPGSTVTDTFPGTLTGITWTCVGAGGGTCTAAGAGNISDSVNLPVGGTVTYTVSATINAAATGSLSNTATVAVSGGVTETSPANNSATDTDTLTPQANLGITKTDGAATDIPGTSITYTIVASNPVGPSNAPGSTVTDTFPAILTGVTWTCVGAGGGSCTAAGAGNISDTVNLPVGGSVTYTVNATIASGALGTLSNTATVATSGSVTETNPANNSATDSDVLTPQADLVIAKAESADPVIAGTSLVYTVTVTNNGPSDALSVNLSDTLPVQVVFVSAVGCTHDGSPVGGVVTCVIGTIVAGNNAVRTINTTVLSSVVDNTNISNTATTTSATPDPGPSLNNTTISTNVQREPDLGVTKTASIDPVIAGTSFSYTVTVTNNGPSDASLVVLTDTLPGEVTFVSAVGCTHDGSAFGGDVTCSIGNLVAGASQVFTIVSFVEPCTLPGTIMLNTATLAHNPAETDPGPTPNTFNLNTTVTTLADVSVTKTDTPDPALAGTRITYTVTITNAGPSCARDVSLLDTFGTNTLFQEGFSDISCIDGGTTATCAQGTMTVGQTIVLTLVGKVDCSAADGSIEINTAVVSSSTPDPDSPDLTATAPTTIDTLAEVSIDKADAPDPVQPASNLNYSIDVFNDGPSDALGVVVTDVLPAGLSYVSGADGCTEVAGTVTCQVGTVPCGKRRQVRIRTRVETDTALTNTASATTTTTESDATNNSDTEQTAIRSGGGVQLRLTAAPRALREGGVTSVVYVLRVRNKSLLAAGGLTLTSTLPSALSLIESQPAPTTSNGGVLTYALTTLAALETRLIVLRAELVAGTDAATPLLFTAVLSEGAVTLDQQTFSGVVREAGPSQGGALEVDLTAVRRTLPGSKLTATVDVVNTGRKAADDVEVVLTAPASLVLDTAFPEPSAVTTVGGQTLVTWDLASLRGPSNTRLKVAYRVPLDALPGSALGLTAGVSDADGRSGSDAHSVEIRD